MTLSDAWVAERSDDGGVRLVRRRVPVPEPAEGELLIRVAWSSVNYKDALAATIPDRIIRRYPLVPGIDLAGTVEASRDSRFREGDAVIATGYELGVLRHGGFAEWAVVPADWAVPLPEGLTLREAMALGTAGFTAALCVRALEHYGLRPDRGPVLVTGATGGVGSIAVQILSGLGYDVVAATGKPDARPYLLALGASEIVPREELTAGEPKPLRSQRWAAAVDTVGGGALAAVLASIRYGGAVAACGLAGGAELATTVYPFILRGVGLLGIDSVYTDMGVRKEIWRLLAGPWKPPRLDLIAADIMMDDIPQLIKRMLAGHFRGRAVVHMKETAYSN